MGCLRDYDVVIVGGRPAGASLAARLGKRGLRVLIVDRANFPCLPQVPSSPAVHPGTMRLLDELDIAEDSYQGSGAKMYAMRVDFGGYFTSKMRLPKLFGRDYAYGIDRRRFDFVLWENLQRFPSVTRHDCFAVTELLQDANGQVTGIVGAPRGEDPRPISAALVVGADGRFSTVARKAGSPIVHEDRKHVSTVHYANWEGVSLLDGDENCAYIYATGRGLDVPMFRMPGRRMCINLHIRAERAEVGGDAQRYYENTLRSVPDVWRLLSSARQVDEVVGIKRVGNGYRKASGAGWVLVGDALHFKDPVDGQGIYDALVQTKLLERAIVAWRSGRRFELAMSDYEHAVHTATGPMFQQTVARLRRELYQEPPVFMIKTFMRWLLTDPAYQQRFIHYFSRALPDDRLMTPELVFGCLSRGLLRDVRSLLRRS